MPIQKKKKLFLQVFYGIFAVWVLFLALVPTILSSGGLKYLTQRKVPGSFSFQKAKLSWFKPQTIYGLVYTQPEIGLEVDVASLTTQATLWNLFLHPRDLQKTEIEGLIGTLNLEKNQRGFVFEESSKLSEAPLSKSSESPPYLILSLPFIGKFNLDHSQFTFKSPEYDSIVFNEIQLNCNMLSKEGPLICNLACETSKSDLSGSAFVNFELGGFDKESKMILTPFDRDILFLSPKGYLQMNAQLTNLPSEGLDHVAMLYSPKLSGLLSSLFGDSLNLGSRIHVIKGKSSVTLNADAPNLNLKFSGSLAQNELSLDQASICNIKLTPSFMKSLSKVCQLSSPLEITKESKASIHLDRLSIPLDFKNFNLNTLSCNAQFSVEEMSFTKESHLKDFKIQQIKGAIDTFDIGENLTFHLKAAAENKNHPMIVKADGQISKLSHLQESEGVEQLNGSCQLEMKEIPSHFLSYLLGNQELLIEVLGPTTSLDLKFEGSPKEGTLDLKLISSRMNFAQTQFKLIDKNLLVLTNPSEFHYKLNPSFAKLVLNPKLSLLHPFDVEAKLKKLVISLIPNERTIKDIDLKLSSKPFETSYENSKSIHIQDTRVYIGKNEEDKIETKAYFTALLPEDYNATFLKEPLNFSILLKNIPFTSQKQSEIAGLIKSKELSFEFEGILDPQFNLHLTEQAKFEFSSSPVDFSKLHLIPNSSYEVFIEPSTLSLSQMASNAEIKGFFKTQNLICKLGEEELFFDEIKAPITFNSVDRSLHFSWEYTPLNLYLQGSLSDLSLKKGKKSQLQVCGIFSKSPSSILSFITQQDLDYSTIAGPTFNLTFEAKKKRGAEHEIDLQYEFSSEQLFSEGELSVDNELRLNQPLQLKYRLTPGKEDSLLSLFSSKKGGEPPFTLIKPVEIVMTLNTLQIDSDSLLPLTYAGEFHLDEISTIQGDLFHVEGFFGTLPDETSFKFQVHAHSILESQPGELFFNYESLNSNLNFSEKNGRFELNLVKFPSKLFQSFLTTIEPKFSLLTESMGSIVNLSSSLEIKQGVGPLEINLDSDFIKTQAHFLFEKNHIVLKEDLHIDLKLNPNLSLFWLSKINPLLKSTLSSLAPLHLTCSQEGFYLPLSPFETEHLSIPFATLEIGQIQLKEDSHLAQFYTLFNQKKDRSFLKAWFAPCKFSIQDGILHLNSHHFQLADKFHIALWGDRDLNRNENAYFIGLPLTTLEEIFGLSKLPHEYVFQIPFKEEKGRLEADWKTAREQLSILSSSASPFVSKNEQSNKFTSDFSRYNQILAETRASSFVDLNEEAFPWSSKQTPSPSVTLSNQESKDDLKIDNKGSEILHQFLKEARKKIH